MPITRLHALTGLSSLALLPALASRASVQVLEPSSRSIAPDCNAAKRLSALTSTNLTLVASPSAAAATARQVSGSIPCGTPERLGMAKPGRPEEMPHSSRCLALTVSNVREPVVAGPAAINISSIR